MIFHTPFIVSQVKYSSEKSLLLDVSFLNPIDDLNKQLYRDIADISKFGEQVETLLNVEFFTSCYGKRPVNSEVNSSQPVDARKIKPKDGDLRMSVPLFQHN